MKNSITDLYLETTRRCNLQCKHCMRGCPENVDLPSAYVDLLFDQINRGSVGIITFGGGEPTLNPGIISYTVDKIIAEKLPVSNIGMITNGQLYSEEIADAFNRYDHYIKNQLIPGYTDEYVSKHTILAFSTDRFHKPISDEVIEQYKERCRWITIEDHFVADKDILKLGRSTFGKKYDYKLYNTKYRYSDDLFSDRRIYGTIYLTANGYITNNSNGAYIDMDELNFGHITEVTLNDIISEYFVDPDGIFPYENIGKSPQRVMRRHVESCE